MGIMTAGWPLAIAATVGSLGAVAAVWSWKGALYLTVAYAAVMLVLVLALFRPAPAGAAPAASGLRGIWCIGGREVPPILLAGLVWGLINAAIFVFLGFAPTFLSGHGLDAGLAGFVTSLAMWIAIPVTLLGGVVTDRSQRANLIIVSGFVLGAVVLALLAAGGAVTGWSAMFGLSLGVAGAIMALPGELLRPQSRATGFGLLYTVYYAAIAIMPAVAGWLLDVSGDRAMPIWFAAALMALGPLALLAVRLLQRRWLPGTATPATVPADP